MISNINLKIVGYLLSAIFLYLAFKETDIKMVIQYLEYTNFLYIFVSFFCNVMIPLILVGAPTIPPNDSRLPFGILLNPL